MSVLVVGADSTIGAALAGEGVLTTTRRTLDLAAPPSSWPELPAVDVAYLCSAVTKLDACERDPLAARRVNVDGTVELARRLQTKGAFVVFLSSNHVFDGREPDRRFDATLCPVNEYGRQKAETEARLGGCAVLRLSKLTPTLFGQWRESLLRGDGIDAFEDMFIAPIDLPAVTHALEVIGRSRQPGTYQLSGPRDESYHDIAYRLAASLSVNPTLVRRASARAAGIPASFLPRHTTLSPRLPE